MIEKNIFKNKRALEKKSFIDRIDTEMKVSKEQVYCYFDDREYMEYDKVEDNYKRNEGFHRYTGDKDKIFGDHPEDIFKIMERNDCDHFIWISKKICDADDAKFSWYYTHELQHLIHYVKNPALCNLSYFLCDTYSGISGSRWPCEVPIEFDCDQKAKNIVKKIFTPNEYEKCIKDVFLEEKEYLKFKELEALIPFDIEKETIQIIYRYREQFKKYSDYLEKYDIDIDDICSR